MSQLLSLLLLKVHTMAAIASKSLDHVFLPIEDDDNNSHYQAYAEAS